MVDLLGVPTDGLVVRLELMCTAQPVPIGPQRPAPAKAFLSSNSIRHLRLVSVDLSQVPYREWMWFRGSLVFRPSGLKSSF